MSQFFISGGQSIGVSVSTLVLPMNVQEQFDLAVQGTLKSFPLRKKFEPVPKHQFFGAQLSL